MSMKIKIIKFEASWCTPCKNYSMIWDELTKESQYQDIEFEVIDIEKNKELVKKYEVKVIPLTVVLQDGQEVQRVSGALYASGLRTLLDRFV